MASRAWLLPTLPVLLAGVVWGQAPRLLPMPTAELVALLPEPPAPGSLAAQADLETVKRIQDARTPEQAARAGRVDAWDIWDYAPVVGPWFAKPTVPRTAALFARLSDELGLVSREAKKRFGRPRPPLVDPAIRPLVSLPATGSYPSGHSLFLFMEAEVLADLFPDLRRELFDFAHRAAWTRVIAGVHFPSDVVAGRLLGQAFVEALRKNPAYLDELEACRAEAAPLRMKKAG